MAKLLLTATRPVSEKLADILAAEGIAAKVHPLLEIIPRELPENAPSPKHILITSRYALAAMSSFTHIPLYVVGKRTAQEAARLGHQVTRVAETIAELLPQLPEDILYLRGEHISQEISLEQIICYSAQLKPPPINLSEFAAIALFSARAAASLSECDSSLLCLSSRIQAALPPSLQQQSLIAKEPTQDGMIALIKYWHTTHLGL